MWPTLAEHVLGHTRLQLTGDVGETGGGERCARDPGSAADVKNRRRGGDEPCQCGGTPFSGSIPMALDLLVVGRSPLRVVLIGLVLGLQS